MEKFSSECQKTVFEKIQLLKHSVNILSGYVQNDYNRLLADGIITKEQIKQSVEEAETSFDLVIDQLIRVKTEVVDLLEHFSK